MSSKFIKVASISGFHIIRISEIVFVSPKDSGRLNKSEIVIRKGKGFYLNYSTETQEEIYDKILSSKKNKPLKNYLNEYFNINKKLENE